MNAAQILMKEKSQIIDGFIKDYVEEISSGQPTEIKNLLSSADYSLMNGGKRFRPSLSLLVAELFETSIEQVLPFAMSVEMIHTYSLIHDDLPCMDDDDERRGKPTNHKAYGEDIALIAGDTLLTEAFFVLAKHYSAELSQKLTYELSRAAGHRGMVGGQAIDLQAQKVGIDQEYLQVLHTLKTGALIEVSSKGAALIAQAESEQVNQLSTFGATLGLAFQVADDILDFEPDDPEKGNFATVIGLDKTKKLLDELSDNAFACLTPWEGRSQNLKDIVTFNLERTY